MQVTTLFDGESLLLRANVHTTSGPLIITFSPLLTQSQSADTGFAEAPLNKLGVNNLAFIARGNHWWQTPEMAAAVQAAQTFIRCASPLRISAYGSSMGAYGALLYADALSCSQVLAFGPQYSIQGSKVPFEKRWRREARALDFSRDDMDSALLSRAEKFVLYDNLTVDRRHVALMQGRNLHKLAVPFGSHVIGQYLKDAGLLKQVLAALIAGKLGEQLPGLLSQARSARKGSAQYRLAMLDALQERPRHRPLMIRLATRFVGERPRNYKLRNRLSRYLLEDGDHAGATRHAEIACQHNTDNPGSLRLLHQILTASGDHNRARQVEEQLLRRAAGSHPPAR
jgi:hypothetical protein